MPKVQDIWKGKVKIHMNQSTKYKSTEWFKHSIKAMIDQRNESTQHR